MRKNLPAFGSNSFGINRNDDALAAEFLGPGSNQYRICQRRGIDADLVRASTQHRLHVVHSADAAAHRERHEAFFRDAFNDTRHCLASVRAGGDVKKDHFVCALFVVAQGQFDGIADVAQFARFSFAELHAAGDLAFVDVEAGDDTFCEH